MIRRHKVEVEFSRNELPITDEAIKLRMLRELDLQRGDTVLTVRIGQRECTRKGVFLFKGIATIEVAADSQKIAPRDVGQRGGPKTVAQAIESRPPKSGIKWRNGARV